MSTKLPASTQAVLDAFTEDNCLHDWKHNHYNLDALAEAFRTAANRIKQRTATITTVGNYTRGWKDGMNDAVIDLLTIAITLEHFAESGNVPTDQPSTEAPRAGHGGL